MKLWLKLTLALLGSSFIALVPFTVKGMIEREQKIIPLILAEEKLTPTPQTPSSEEVLTPKQYLYAKAGAQAQILDRIITCESGWNPEAKNPNSTASGLGQFIKQTWVDTRGRMLLPDDPDLRFDPYESIDTMIYLWDEGGGASHWSASKHCWSYD